MTLHHVLPETFQQTDGRAVVGGVALSDIARRYGTPAYLFDVQHLVNRLSQFSRALNGLGTPVYASKAFWCTAMAELVNKAGWWVDVVSVGEAAIAIQGGIPSQRILLHGNLKTDQELSLALSGQVAMVVIDSPHEAERLEEIARSQGVEVDVMVRLNQETGLLTHQKVLTSGEGAKFGMPPGIAGEVVGQIATSGCLRLRGVHLHAGSHVNDPNIYKTVACLVAEFAATHRSAFAEEPIWLNMGGGLVAPYLRTDPIVTPAAAAAAVEEGLESSQVAERVGSVKIMFEPGRSVAANAGVLLYSLGVRKQLPKGGEMLALDGGMTDNPRPGLYGAQYELLVADRLSDPHDQRFAVFGRSCESDLILDQVQLPSSVEPGDVVVIPAAGAYTFSMSSRYNALPRPPVLFVRDGQVREVISRETVTDLMKGQRGWEQAQSWHP